MKRKIAQAVLLALALVIALNFSYVKRLATYPRSKPITSLAWYTPLETVTGVLEPKPFPSKPTSFDDAAKWAEAHNSSAFLVLHNGALLVEDYFLEFTQRSFANSMSMTKGIVALALGVAIKEGKIGSEEDEIGKYLKEWSADARGRIKIKDLLQMTSGLKFDDNQFNPLSGIARMHGMPDAQAVALETQLGAPPGAHFHYTNVNYQLLGMLIERATGERFAEYVSEKIWKPIGASDAAVWLDREGGHPKTYCCFFATARDWLRVGQLMLDRGKTKDAQVVTPEWVDKMTAPSQHEREYGFGLWLGYPYEGAQSTNRAKPRKVADMFYFDGQGKQRMYIVPSKKLIVLRLGENANDWNDATLVDEIVDKL